MSKEKWNSRGKVVSASAVTPSNSDLNEYDALYVGTAGELSIVLRDDTTAVTLSNVPNGEILPFSVKYVKASGTTASSIIGLKVEE